ncbi:MAG: T9SS type A sorting domain-containing protein [Sphingobacteriaceae bacterium]|nr:T9SS type A sorting domain-containing protein [Sphingobacteriaceae bacterium]
MNVQNCSFTGFGEAVRLSASAAGLAAGHTLQGLTIGNYLVNGINASFQNGLTLSNNTLQDFRGSTNTGAALLLENLTNANINANRVKGTLPANAIRLSNMNADGFGGINMVSNNEISGVTNTANGSTGVTRGLWLTGSTANGRDAVAVVHNSISYRPVGTNTAQTQALVYIDGATATSQPFNTLVFLNNNLVEPVLDNTRPAGFAPLIFSHPTLVDSMVIGYNNYFKPAENTSLNLIRIQAPVTAFNTLAAWRAAYPVDSASLNVSPLFLSANVLQPLSPALDNRGIPFAGVNADIQGIGRGPIPDIGAYEFTGQVLSSFVFTPLANTTATTNRTVQIVINDSTGLITGVNGPRLFYRKQNQTSFQIDSTPVVLGNSFEFVINSAALGGVQPGDSVFYYFATLNTVGTVTTLPLGGGGNNPVGINAPTALLSYEISRTAQGRFRVGTNGDFATLTAAAAFINSAQFVDTATFVLIDTLYQAGETFPIVFTRNNARSANHLAIIRPDSGVVARISGNLSATTTALLLFDDANHVVLDGSWVGSSASALRITTPSTTASTSLVRLQGSATVGTENIQIRNTLFEAADSEVNLQFAIFVGGGAITVSSEGRHRLLQISGNQIQRIWQGIYVGGLSSQLAYGVNLSNNFLGSNDLTHKLGARGIWLHNTDSALVRGNVMRNLISALAVPKVGVQVSGTNNQLRIDRNDIRFVSHTAFSGIQQGSYGIFIQGGNAVEITNNIIAGMRGGNTGNSSFDVASGIRLSGGAGHKLYYNTVHLYGVYDQPATGAAAASALSVTATGVNNLDVRNNIFSNTLSSVSTSTGVYFAAMWFVQNYSLATSTFNNNAYAVANSSQNLVARFSTLVSQIFLQELPDFLAQSQIGNATNDVNSIPVQGKVPAPFVSDLILSIDTTIATPYESGGVQIASLGVPNVDYFGIARPAFGGTAPDIGAIEFAGLQAGDEQAPLVSNFFANPSLNACAPVSRNLSITLTDSTGVQSAQLLYRINQGALQTAAFSLSTGTVINGSWTATLPAAGAGSAVHFFLVATDSLGNSTDTLRLGTTRDAYLAVSPLQRDTTLNGGSPLPRSTTGNAGGLLISEVFYNRILTGAQSNYPTGFPTASSQVAIEVSNNSRLPINLAGKQLKIEGFFTHVVSLPAITLDSGAVIVFVAGTAANQPANGIYGLANTGGTSPFNSSNVVGVWIEEVATREVIDAVSINGHVFSLASGVNNTDFNGTVTAANRASIQRIGSALSNQSGWVTSESNFLSSIGSYNPTLSLDPATYTWRRAGNPAVLASGNSISFVPVISGTYVLSYADSFCTVTDSFEVTLIAPDLAISAFITPTNNDVVRDPVEVKVWVKNVGSASYQGPLGVRYRVNNGLPNSPVSVNVNLNAGDSTEVTLTPNWVPGPAGAYTLCALLNAVSGDQNQANDTLCVTLNSSVSVEDTRFAQLRLYPNPAKDRALLSGLPAGSYVKVQNMQGQLIFSTQVEQLESLELETSGWQAGVYQISIQCEGKFATRKLMVTR